METFRASGVDKDSDAALVAATKSGETHAFEKLVVRYERRVFAVAQRITNNREDAEDVVQESFHKTFLYLDTFQEKSKFSTWLTRIVINAALMRRRSKRSRPAVSLDDWTSEGELPLAERFADESPNPEQIYAGTELRERVGKKLAEISPLLRTAFWLREIEGLSAEEAAHALGVSRNTLKARLWRARQELAARLGLGLDTNLAPAT